MQYNAEFCTWKNLIIWRAEQMIGIQLRFKNLMISKAERSIVASSPAMSCDVRLLKSDWLDCICPLCFDRFGRNTKERQENMASLRFRRFTKVRILEEIGRELLGAFLDGFRVERVNAGTNLAQWIEKLGDYS